MYKNLEMSQTLQQNTLTNEEMLKLDLFEEPLTNGSKMDS